MANATLLRRIGVLAQSLNDPQLAPFALAVLLGQAFQDELRIHSCECNQSVSPCLEYDGHLMANFNPLRLATRLLKNETVAFDWEFLRDASNGVIAR